MTAIVCVSQSWGIGRDGALLFRISADHKRFRALTVGKTVILGVFLSLQTGRYCSSNTDSSHGYKAIPHFLFLCYDF